MKKVISVFLICIIAVFFSIPVLAAADTSSSEVSLAYEDGTQADREAAARSALSDRSAGLPTGRVTYVLKQIPELQTAQTNISMHAYVNFDTSLSITSLYMASAAAQWNYIRGYNSSTHNVNLYVGDYITLDPDWTVPPASQTFLDTYFEVVDWLPDTSSPYNNIRSTLSHYLFNDDFSNVPFGSGWIDLFSTAATLMLFVLPVLVIFGLCKLFWGGLTYGH